MHIRKLTECEEIVAGDACRLRELLSPVPTPDLELRCSIAHARLAPGQTTLLHRMKTCEVYHILEGVGLMHIDDERAEVLGGDTVYIPPGAAQQITSLGPGELVFLCVVDPAWRAEDEEIL